MNKNTPITSLLVTFLVGMGAGYFLSSRSQSQKPPTQELASAHQKASQQKNSKAEANNSSPLRGNRTIASVNPEQELLLALEGLSLNSSRNICQQASQNRLTRIMAPFLRAKDSAGIAESRHAVDTAAKISPYWSAEYSIPVVPAQRVSMLLRFHEGKETEAEEAPKTCWTITLYTDTGMSGMGGCGSTLKDGIPYINFETSSRALSSSVSALAYPLPPGQLALHYDNAKDTWEPSTQFTWSPLTADEYEHREKLLSSKNTN